MDWYAMHRKLKRICTFPTHSPHNILCSSTVYTVHGMGLYYMHISFVIRPVFAPHNFTIIHSGRNTICVFAISTTMGFISVCVTRIFSSKIVHLYANRFSSRTCEIYFYYMRYSGIFVSISVSLSVHFDTTNETIEKARQYPKPQSECGNRPADKMCSFFALTTRWK